MRLPLDVSPQGQGVTGVMYLSSNWHTIMPSYRSRFGYIQNLARAGCRTAIENGHPWMLDNGAFSDKWTEREWVNALTRWQPYTQTCIAAVCPDVVADADTTLARFWQYAPLIREVGYPVAFVTQDGLRLRDVPWGAFDVLFVGGTDDHKLRQSWPVINAAIERGVWVHVGRVNTVRRIRLFWQADSVDGTTLSISPTPHNQRLILHAAEEAAAKKEMPQLL